MNSKSMSEIHGNFTHNHTHAHLLGAFFPALVRDHHCLLFSENGFYMSLNPQLIEKKKKNQTKQANKNT